MATKHPAGSASTARARADQARAVARHPPQSDVVELRHLRYFVAVADARSFTRAAEDLRISQPTLSHQIRQLEARLETVLFDRHARRVELTAAGKAFKPYTDRILKELQDGVLAVAELQGLVRGTLRMAVFHSFASSLLGPVLAEFALRYPGVRVLARLQPRLEMERDLLSGALDLAVAYVSENTEHILAEKLFDEELVLIVGRRHSLARRSTLPKSALADLKLVLLSEEFGARQFLNRYFAREKLAPHVVLEMNAIEPILSTIHEAPLGTVLSSGVVAGRPGLHSIRLVRPTPKRTCAILWRREGYRQAAALRMAEMIRAAYREAGKL